MSNRPVIALTMGDAAGIGPEVVVKAAAHHDLSSFCTPVAVGDLARLRRAASLCGVSVELEAVDQPREATAGQGRLAVLDVGGVPEDLPFGELSAVAGEAAYRFIERAAELARGRRGGRDLHRAAQQGGAARRRPQLPRPHRAARRT